MKKIIAGRGEFTASEESYAVCLKRSRASLVASLVQIYAGRFSSPGDGSRASHWRNVSKSDMALIVASCERPYENALAYLLTDGDC